MKLSQLREKIQKAEGKFNLLGSDYDFDLQLKIEMCEVKADKEYYSSDAQQKIYDKGFADGAKWYREQLKQRQ